MIIENLFPTAVSFFDLNRPFTEEELSFVKELPLRSNAGNRSSEDSKILNSPQLADINVFINSAVQKYLAAVYAPADSVGLYVTQSWLNVTNSGEFHHKHRHPNSFLSGVFYFNAEKDVDKITFFKTEQAQLRIRTEVWNPYNSESWYFPVETGKLVLFPSTLEHMVTKTESKEPRISLAFNTFLRGELGDQADLTHLILEK
jgi:uncharacterized protein (TIGR02466 family)